MRGWRWRQGCLGQGWCSSCRRVEQARALPALATGQWFGMLMGARRRLPSKVHSGRRWRRGCAVAGLLGRRPG
ncbi:hypothetical protein E2562_035024 [Oryza meyeriana var. granulata]|uniref:Uncharacterized protein n=1 Tax=Oryza meyeriana var. granulata TaxID=110450 RepID=A0A6G1FFM0_9ORYZ|nr:hypothetical protein E2562_035024 [Oryza meyeriana var. granulata]